MDAAGQILGHLAIINSLDAGLLEILAELGEIGVSVQVGAVFETPGPGKDGGHGVGGGGVALLVLAVVPGDGTVGGLGLDGLTVRAHQY